MLLIFDLDDTLIDTSGSIAPPLLEKALDRMVKAGMAVTNVKEARGMLARLYSSSASGTSGMREFVELMDGTPALAEVGIETIYDPVHWDRPVRATEGANELLELFARDHQLALVTLGREEVQKRKLEAGGIESSLFSMVCVTQERNKALSYTRVLEKLGFTPSQAIMIGDRIELDLSPAKALGITTVHIRQGRGLGNTGLKRDVDYTILSLSELVPIVERLASIGRSSLKQK